MRSSEIREKYLRFFEERGSERWPSSSLIPDDPSMLLTSAGMVQFKPYFLGVKKLDAIGTATCQKCLRTTDIDIIGTTGRHLSFFEMLGNFSFGGYDKRQASEWAHDFAVNELELPEDKLYYSIYELDEEAHDIWREIGIAEDRIVRLGEEDNFWAAGPTGPCGPCSEIYYDQGPEVGCGSDECAPGCDCDRFVEFWNLVFTDFDRQEDGTLVELETKNIDTGMGLERMAAILQGVQTNYETDILRGLIGTAEELSGLTYGEDEKNDLALRILADHSRALTFMIADGILPGNEGRGYVLRRLLRRASRYGHLIGIEGAFLGKLIDTVIDEMGDVYPEIRANSELIHGIVAAEEERFQATLRKGLAYLDEEIVALEASGVEDPVLDGVSAFTLHDTYGFPIDLTREIAGEHGIDVDIETFESEMEAQRSRARANVKGGSWSTYEGVWADLAQEVPATVFTGYEKDEDEATIVALVAGEERVESASAGDELEIILDRTPFYGEHGGQVGDIGTLSTAAGAFADVKDTTIAQGGLVSHHVVIEEGALSVGDAVHATIDAPRRERIRRNHTATHILHWALRKVLGEHATQAGSLVAPDRLRFDITHFEAITPDQLAEVERLANHKIMEGHQVIAYETSLENARDQGVTALFGEKYGEFVRVLESGNFSRELCGGTHVSNTSDIGLLKIVSESSVGSNLRRIEAVTSYDALDHYRRSEELLEEAAAALKTRPQELTKRIASLQKEISDLKADNKKLRSSGNSVDLDALLAEAHDVGYPLIVTQVNGYSPSELRELWDRVRTKLGESALIVASVTDDDLPALLAAGTPGAVEKGFDAGAVIKHISRAIQGGGGGKPAMAQAGGRAVGGIPEALDRARQMYGV